MECWSFRALIAVFDAIAVLLAIHVSCDYATGGCGVVLEVHGAVSMLCQGVIGTYFMVQVLV